jgi:hypothetical protein
MERSDEKATYRETADFPGMLNKMGREILNENLRNMRHGVGG